MDRPKLVGRHGRPAGGAEGAGRLDAAVGPARDAGARRRRGRAGAGGVDGQARPRPSRPTSRPCSKHCGRTRPSTSLNRSCSRSCSTPRTTASAPRRRASPRRGAAADQTRWRCWRRASGTTRRRCGWRRCGRWPQVPSVHSAEMALEALDRPMDKWLDYAPVADGARAGAGMDAGVAAGQIQLRRQPAAASVRAGGGGDEGRAGAAGEAGQGAARRRRTRRKAC